MLDGVDGSGSHATTRAHSHDHDRVHDRADPQDSYLRRRDDGVKRRDPVVAQVGDRGIAIRHFIKLVPPGHEIVIADIGGTSDQGADINARALAKNDSVLVHQKHAAVGSDLAEYGRRIVSNHTVEDRCVRRWLDKAHPLASSYRKGLPVDNGGGCALGHGHGHAVGCDTCAACRRRGALR